ncbi:hypothetical protein OQA88_7034 [Cercophora sp. LCS_1]
MSEEPGPDRNPVCEDVGEPMPDIAGIGIIVAFTLQALISLVLSLWVFFFSRSGRLDVHHDDGTAEHAIEVKRLESILDILMVGNDIQMLTGIALIITGLASAGDVNLYHLHLIYDTVSFVGVSNAAALVTWTFLTAKHPSYTPRPKNRLTFRHKTSYAFALLFLALTILFLIRLNAWSIPGACYLTAGLSAPGAGHPTVDKVYVSVTAAWLIICMLLAVFHGARHRKVVLLVAMGQFPVHVYALVALKVGNRELVEGENEWDFGQTTAVLLLGVTLRECWGKGVGLWRFERRLKRDVENRSGRNGEGEEGVRKEAVGGDQQDC